MNLRPSTEVASGRIDASRLRRTSRKVSSCEPSPDSPLAAGLVADFGSASMPDKVTSCNPPNGAPISGRVARPVHAASIQRAWAHDEPPHPVRTRGKSEGTRVNRPRRVMTSHPLEGDNGRSVRTPRDEREVEGNDPK